MSQQCFIHEIGFPFSRFFFSRRQKKIVKYRWIPHFDDFFASICLHYIHTFRNFEIIYGTIFFALTKCVSISVSRFSFFRRFAVRRSFFFVILNAFTVNNSMTSMLSCNNNKDQLFVYSSENHMELISRNFSKLYSCVYSNFTKNKLTIFPLPVAFIWSISWMSSTSTVFFLAASLWTILASTLPGSSS